MRQKASISMSNSNKLPVIESVRMGERVILTLRGEPVAVISPIDREAVEGAVRSEAERAERESLGWLTASEGAFSFWENEEDEIWDEVAEGSARRTEEG